MKLGIAQKITLLVISMILFSVLTIVFAGYFVNYNQIDKAAGEELIGCANITVGLVSPQEVKALAMGKEGDLAAIEKSLDWIIDHKPIFKNAQIIGLDGKLIALDKNLKKQGSKEGDFYHLDETALQHIKEMKHPAYSEIYSFGGAERKTGYAPIFIDHNSKNEIVALMSVDFDASVIS